MGRERKPRGEVTGTLGHNRDLGCSQKELGSCMYQGTDSETNLRGDVKRDTPPHP